MHTCDTTWLPSLNRFLDTESEPEYLDRVYGVFLNDLVRTSATFLGKPVLIPRSMLDGKHQKFWHLVTENPQGTSGEAARNIDVFRCERLGWIAPILAEAPSSRVRVWEEDSRGEARCGAALSDFSYVIHLAKREAYWQLITAYCVEYERRREKFKDQWRQFRVATENS